MFIKLIKPISNALVPSHMVLRQNKIHIKFMQDISLITVKQKILYVNEKGFITPVLPEKNICISSNYGKNVVKEYVLKPNVTFISGIYQPGINLLPPLLHDVINSLFGQEAIKNEQDFFLRVAKCLKNNLYVDHADYFPVLQHVLVSILAHFKIPISILKKLTEDLVDYSAFEGYPISSNTIIEAEVFSTTILSFIRNNVDKLHVVAKNPENNLQDFIQHSYRQGKQPFMDWRFHLEIETINNKIFFLDSKLISNPVKFLSLTKGHISLATSINTTYLIKRFIGDSLRASRNKNTTLKEQQLIEDFCKSLSDKLNDKKCTSQDLFLHYVDVRNQMFLDQHILTIIPSSIQQTKMIDISRNDIVNNLMEDFIIHDIIKQELFKEKVIETLIPHENKDQQVHVKIWHDFIVKIINKYPDNIKQQLIDNFHKFKLLEYANHL